MWGLGSYGRLGLGEVMDVPLARRTSEHHGSLGREGMLYPQMAILYRENE